MDPKDNGIKNRGYAANILYFFFQCLFAASGRGALLRKEKEERNDKLKNELAIKRSEIEEANKETEQLKRRYAAASSECEQLKKEHELYMMKKGMTN